MKIPIKRISSWINILSSKKGDDFLDISVAFVTDAEIRKLNRQYRGKNKPTDVLAFLLCHPERNMVKRRILSSKPRRSFGASRLRMTGDIVISVEMAKKNAERFGKTVVEEIKFLVVHGFLHLFGYDHEISKKEEIRMQKKEKECMKLLENY